MLPNFLKSFISEQINSEFSKLLESLELKDMTDDEIIKKYKHTKWRDLNNYIKSYFKKRYKLNVYTPYDFTFSSNPFKYTISEENFIADEIPYALDIIKTRNECIELGTKTNTEKPKRKPKKLGDEAPKSKAKKLGEE